MDLDDAWKATTTEPGVFETYVDAFGIERSEEVASVPPASLVAKGPVASGAARLDFHTGEPKRATKRGGGLPGVAFDDDLSRAGARVNEANRARLVKSVSVNRTDTQAAPAHEAFEGRGGLYDGLNYTLSRAPALFPVTNRSLLEPHVYGAEHAGTQTAARPAAHVEALKAGQSEVEGRHAVHASVCAHVWACEHVWEHGGTRTRVHDGTNAHVRT